MKKLLFTTALIACTLPCLSDETNAPSAKPSPVHLESLKGGVPPVPPPSAHHAMENNPTNIAKAAPAKEMAIIIYGATVFAVGNQQVWVIPERYMEDMKRIYKFQTVSKAALPEP